MQNLDPDWDIFSFEAFQSGNIDSYLLEWTSYTIKKDEESSYIKVLSKSEENTHDGDS